MKKEPVQTGPDKFADESREVDVNPSNGKRAETEARLKEAKCATRNQAGERRDVGKEAIDSVKNAPSRR